MNEPASPPRSTRRVIASWVLRIGVTVAALTWALSQTDMNALGAAFGRITTIALGGAVLLFFANLLAATVRWRVLLATYGSQWRAPLPLLYRIYVVALFYNTVLPANVGGDVMRGFVTRRAFPGAAGAYLIVFIERMFGLAGIFLLAAMGLILRPLDVLPNALAVALGALLASLAAAASPLFARRLAPWLPGRLGTMAAALPIPTRPVLLVVVLVLSVVTQGLVALTGHVLLVSIGAPVGLFDSLTLIPVAMAAVYAPTVAGLGARELAFVVVLGAIGISEADAVAGSLALFGAQLIAALFGGLLHLVAPLPEAALEGQTSGP
jgi:glycosyltransferase 2 family protein